jgi:hypothetical protein
MGVLDQGKSQTCEMGLIEWSVCLWGWECEDGVVDKTVVCRRCSDTGDFCVGPASWGGCFPRIVESGRP